MQKGMSSVYCAQTNGGRVLYTLCTKPSGGRDLYTLCTNLNKTYGIFVACRATTHTDLVLRARQEGLQYKVVHNASIMNAIGCCGLQVTAPGVNP